MENATLKLQLTNVKCSIDRAKAIISGITLDMGRNSGYRKLTKLQHKKYYMNRKLKYLIAEKNKLEKELKYHKKEVF